jgi:hypothetical protein
MLEESCHPRYVRCTSEGERRVHDVFARVEEAAIRRTPTVRASVTLFIGMFTTLLAIINPLEALPI